MLNAPTMKGDRINFRRSMPVHENQQIFEIVSVSHSTSAHVPKARDEAAPSVFSSRFGCFRREIGV